MIASLGTFNLYVPQNPTEFVQYLINSGVIFLKNENDQDWYNITIPTTATHFGVVNNGQIIAASIDISNLWPNGNEVLISDAELEIGDYWDGIQITKEVVPEIPFTVTSYQAKMALQKANLFDFVDSTIANSANNELKIAWTEATYFDRNSRFILEMQPILQLSDTQIDDLFVEAAKIN